MARAVHYLPGLGDNLSAKMACEPQLYKAILGENRTFEFLDNFASQRKPLSQEEFYAIRSHFYSDIATYAEFPPVWRGPSRFESRVPRGLLDKATWPPLFARRDLNFSNLDFDEEARRYTHIPYIKLKHV